ncbi:MAG: YwiC-like family protein [Propionibacteriaceae bacterium]|jgi:hypothetical protein|nr:YwiC-like family protein [Propionibacteriaceae bacterium]
MPKQYGVWAMLLAPLIVGSVMGGFGWFHVVLMAAWLAAYLCFMAVRGCLRRRGGSAYRTPALVYAAATTLAVSALLVWRPALVWWAIPLALLLGGSLVLIIRGHERSVLNDALLIAASCLMTVVAATADHLTELAGGEVVAVVAGSSSWSATAVLVGYFWGTILYVKTMIRERGKRGWYWASVGWHLAMVAAAVLANAWIVPVAVVVAARAALVPRLWPRAKPALIGAGEVVATVTLVVTVCLTMA